jgi:uncharacterized protein
MGKRFMGLFRLLLLGAAIYVIYTLIRRLGAAKPQIGHSHPADYSDTVRCAHCGVHMPRDRALRSRDGHYYCTPEHRDANHS